MAARITDRILMGLVRGWSFLRYPEACLKFVEANKALPNAAMPVSDVDKFLWRKIFDHNPLFTIACDKLAAKDHALSICPELKTAKVLWSGTEPETIPAQLLAGDVLVKANHGSRWNIMIQGGKVDRANLMRRASRWARRRYGRNLAEWAYRDARRMVLVEEMLLEDGHPVRSEYKFHISDGVTSYVYVTRKKDEGGKNWCCLDRDGAVMPLETPNPTWIAMPGPPSFSKMRDMAETLAAPYDYMRVDLYDLGGETYFSELTVYPLSGRGMGTSRVARLRNDNWDLRNSWFLTNPQSGWRAIYAGALRRWLDANQPRSGGPSGNSTSST